MEPLNEWLHFPYIKCYKENGDKKTINRKKELRWIAKNLN